MAGIPAGYEGADVLESTSTPVSKFISTSGLPKGYEGADVLEYNPRTVKNFLTRAHKFITSGDHTPAEEGSGKAAENFLRIAANTATGIPMSVVGGIAATGQLLSPRNPFAKIKGEDSLTRASNALTNVSNALHIEPRNAEDAAVEETVNNAIVLPFKTAGLGLGGIVEGVTTGDLQKASDVIEGKSEGSSIAVPIAKIIGEASALFGFGKAGKSIKARAKTVTNSNWYRKLTIKERELVVQSLDDIMRSGLSEAEAVRKYPNLFKEAIAKRNKGEAATVKSTETPIAEPVKPTPIVRPAEAPAPVEQPIITANTRPLALPPIPDSIGKSIVREVLGQIKPIVPTAVVAAPKTFTSKKGNVYTKQDNTIKDAEGNIITDPFKVRSINKGIEKSTKTQDIPIGYEDATIIESEKSNIDTLPETNVQPGANVEWKSWFHSMGGTESAKDMGVETVLSKDFKGWFANDKENWLNNPDKPIIEIRGDFNGQTMVKNHLGYEEKVLDRQPLPDDAIFYKNKEAFDKGEGTTIGELRNKAQEEKGKVNPVDEVIPPDISLSVPLGDASQPKVIPVKEVKPTVDRTRTDDEGILLRNGWSQEELGKLKPEEIKSKAVMARRGMEIAQARLNKAPGKKYTKAEKSLDRAVASTEVDEVGSKIKEYEKEIDSIFDKPGDLTDEDVVKIEELNKQIDDLEKGFEEVVAPKEDLSVEQKAKEIEKLEAEVKKPVVRTAKQVIEGHDLITKAIERVNKASKSKEVVKENSAVDSLTKIVDKQTDQAYWDKKLQDEGLGDIDLGFLGTQHLQKLYEAGINLFKRSPSIENLTRLGKTVVLDGVKNFKDFTNRIKVITGKLFDKVSKSIRDAWNGVKAWLDETNRLDMELNSGKHEDEIQKAIKSTVKSAIDKFSNEAGAVAIREEKPFYSKLEEVVTFKMSGKMPVEQLNKMLKNNGVSDAEINNVLGGLSGSVTKQDVLEEIKVNKTKFEDVVLGDTLTPSSFTMYSNFPVDKLQDVGSRIYGKAKESVRTNWEKAVEKSTTAASLDKGVQQTIKGIQEGLLDPSRIMARDPVAKQVFEELSNAEEDKNKFLLRHVEEFMTETKDIKPKSVASERVGMALDGKLESEKLNEVERKAYNFLKNEYDFLINEYARRAAGSEEAYQKVLKLATREDFRAKKISELTTEQKDIYNKLKDEAIKLRHGKKVSELNEEELEAYEEAKLVVQNYLGTNITKGMTEGEKEAYDLLRRKISDYLPHLFNKDELLNAFKTEIGDLNNKLRTATNKNTVTRYKNRLGKLEKAVTQLNGGEWIRFNQLPQNVMFKFFNERKGKEGYSYDAIKAYQAYIYGIARKMFDEPALKRTGELYKNIDPSLKPYTKELIDHYMGYGNKGDMDWIVSGLTSLEWMRTLGLNPRSAITNFTQRLNTTVYVGEKYAAKAEHMMLFDRKNANELFHKSGVAREVPQTLMEGTPASSTLEKARTVVGFMFNAVELGNRKHAYIAGYMKAKDAGMSDEAAMKEGIKTVHATQFRYGKLGTAKWYRDGVGRLALQFTSFTAKNAQFLYDLWTKNPKAFMKYVAYFTGINYITQEFLDTDISNALGFGINFGEALNVIKSMANGDIHGANRHIKQVVQSGGGMLPSGFGPFVSSAVKVSGQISGGKALQQLRKEITPIIGSRIKQAYLAVKNEEDGEYPIYDAQGHLMYRLNARQMIQRTLGPKTVEESKSFKDYESSRNLEQERKEVIKEIVNAILDEDTDKAEKLMEEYEIAPSDQAIDNEIIARKLTKEEQGTAATKEVYKEQRNSKDFSIKNIL